MITWVSRIPPGHDTPPDEGISPVFLAYNAVSLSGGTRTHRPPLLTFTPQTFGGKLRLYLPTRIEPRFGPRS